MVKASIKLADGTRVEIDGSPEEVERLMSLYDKGGGSSQHRRSDRPTSRSEAQPDGKSPTEQTNKPSLDLSVIINAIKDCDEAELIEEKILDRNSQVDRTLLPLYIVHEYMENEHALSSGDVNKVTTQLSVPVSTPNASTTLAGAASKYVIGDATRKKGSAVRYKLNRRGVKYMKSILSGDAGE